MKRLLENPNIWLDVYNECVNDAQTAVICQTYLESSAEIRIFETIFQQILGNVLIIPSEEILDEKIYKVTVKDLSNSVAYSIISSKMSKELCTKLWTRTTYILAEQLKSLKDKLSKEIFNRILGEKKWIEKTDEMMQIVKLKWRTELISMELLFDHSFQRDILEGTVSIEEKEFVREGHTFLELLFSEQDENSSSNLKAYENFLNDYYEKCRAKMGIP
jgi:hypothetical protein